MLGVICIGIGSWLALLGEGALVILAGFVLILAGVLSLGGINGEEHND